MREEQQEEEEEEETKTKNSISFSITRDLSVSSFPPLPTPLDIIDDHR
jgi:hypothetical protein